MMRGSLSPFWQRRWLARVLPPLGLALLTLGFFWQPLFLPGWYFPKGGGDLASFLYPVYRFAAENLQRGVVPLWNPYIFSGMPFAADMQSGLFYPVNWIAFLLARPFTYRTMEYLVILHFFLAALFTYLYLRSLGLSPLAACGGGVVFAFSGSLVARAGHLNTMAASIWLPLALLFFHRGLTGGDPRAMVAAALVFGISLLTSHPQMSLYTALFLGLYWLWALLVFPMVLSWRQRLHRLLLLIPFFLVAGLSAAVQLLPSGELASHSLRAAISYEHSREFAFSPLGLITLVLPHFFGADLTDYWGIPGSLTEAYGYAGVVTLALGALAVLLGRHHRGWMVFFLAGALLFLLLSLGDRTPFHGWLYRFVPGFDKVRAPARFLVFFDFALAVLAAFGLERLRYPLGRRDLPRLRLLLWGMALTLGGGLLLAAPWLYAALLTSQGTDPTIFKRIALAIESLNLTLLFWAMALGLLLLFRYRPRGRPLVLGLVLGLLVLDLFSANMVLNPAAGDPLENYRHPRVLAAVQQESAPYRIDSFTDVWDVWQPNIALTEGFSDVMGIFNPMMLADYERYWASLGSRSVPAYDLLNVKYVVGHKDVVLDWGKFTPHFTDAPRVNLYRNTQALPRALLVPAAEMAPREEMLRRLASASFDPARLLLLEQEPPLRAPEADPSPSSPLLVQYPNPNEVVVAGEAMRPVYLFLSEVFYPGWRAWVNGQETPVLRATYLFRAVVVPQGPFVVRFVFDPPLVKVGAALSALTWLAALSWVLWGLRRRRGGGPR